jgi:hypothetical protein
MKGKIMKLFILVMLVTSTFMINVFAKPIKKMDGSKPRTDFRGEYYTLNIHVK